MNLRSLLLTLFLFSVSITLFAQDAPVKPSHVGTGVFLGETPPLRDVPALTTEEYNAMVTKAELRVLNRKLKNRYYPYEATALPKGPDPVWQHDMGRGANPKSPIVNFAGQSSPYYPPDCNGTAGPNHYMQTVNTTYAIYSKTGTLLAGPTNMNTLFSGTTGSSCNDGDPLILYDEQADRWLAVEFSICGSNDYMLVAVSSTNDPTGTWYKYSFDVADMPDYEKFGIWQDGYYMGSNNSTGNDIYVFQRSVMLTGGASPLMVGFNNPYRPTTIDGFVCVPPVDNDGAYAPAGAPGLFIAMNDDAIGGGSDQLWIYELDVDWSNTSASTFTRTQQIDVAAFDSNFGNDWTNIKQPGTSQELDAIPQVIMNVPQYRNFGSYQTIVCCHTVDVDATDHAGIRWYELRKTTGNWSIRQQGTYAPDTHSRWMGSISMNANSKIALGYSVSSASVYPSIRYTGQSAGAYATGAGVLDVPEESIQVGANSQTTYERWGDYALMSVDPYDNETFWFTTEYIGSGGSRLSKIASFKIGNSPTAITQAATSVTGSSAVLNGTVNPNGLATSYYFQWGTSTSYGNTTSTQSAGSGTSNLAVNAPISGLSGGTTYHFRLVAANSDGTTNGSDLTFTPGAASVTTTAATAITTTTATSGGNVITDGGYAVTARGVCWGTSANPDISGSHTTDGTGTGTFTSSLTGLSSNTTYHIRAYATNSNGTFYGEDLQFTTLCGIITSFPYNEGFENGGVIPSCWSQTYVTGTLNWTYQAGGQSGHPAAAHTGSYNAFFYKSSSTASVTKLITPPMNLASLMNPQLTFWHTQALWSPDQDELRVYYRTSATGTWTLLATYTSNITSWTQETISLPNGSSDYYIAFEGTAKYGYGVCVDDMTVTGTGQTLVVTPSNQNVTYPAGSTSFSVTSNSSWTVTSDAAWCTVTPSGSGNGTITANYTQNTNATVRIANITVTVTGLTPVVVTVTQAGNVTPTLTVTPSNQNVTALAGSTNFTVTSNSAWTASSNAAWCTVTSGGAGNGTIVANYTENTVLSPRVATVTVTVTGLTPVTVTVTQAAASPTLTVTPSNQNVSSAAGNTSFTVTSNSSWTASSNQAWCTVTSSGTGNGTILATYALNSSLSLRIATITVTVSGLSPVAVTVTQSGTSPTLTVTPSNQNVAYTAGNTSFSVTSNSAWTVASNMSWCTVTPSGTGNGSITATVTANPDLTSRVATVTVTVAGIPAVSVTVTQAGAPPTMNVSPQNLIVNSDPGTGEFTITSNSSWTAYCSQVWCSVTSSGAGNGILTATYTENLAITQRIATITVTPAGGTPVQVTLTQTAAAPVLKVTPEECYVSYEAGSVPLYLYSNISWTAVSNSAWCTVPASGNGNMVVNAQYTENQELSPRTAEITFMGTDVDPVVVTVYQTAGLPVVQVTPSNQNVAYAGGNAQFDVSSNASWVAASDAAWCTVNSSGTGNGVIDAEVAENTMPSVRIANISVTVPGTSPVVVTVTQEAAPVTLSVTPPIKYVTAVAGSANFTVASNTIWTAVSDVDWCAVTPTGNGNGTITATYQENVSVVSRLANITVSANGIDSQTVQLIQEPSQVSLTENPYEGITVYPNPASGKFTLGPVPAHLQSLDIEILNLEGQVVQSKKCTGKTNYAFDLTKLPKGCYILRFETEEKLVSYKVILR